MEKYSIIIAIYNEVNKLNALLIAIKPYMQEGHEIIIIDDGSNDGSTRILKENEFIKLLVLKGNRGKGFAIKQGLKLASNNKIIIYDGDMEINPRNISNLMVLNKQDQIRFVTGSRFISLTPFKSNFDWGNFMFTSFFNIAFNRLYKDVLCCAKAFYLSDINKSKIISRGFDIDVELLAILSLKNKAKKVFEVKLDYSRRSAKNGKKLKVSDGWVILARIIKMIRYY